MAHRLSKGKKSFFVNKLTGTGILFLVPVHSLLQFPLCTSPRYDSPSQEQEESVSMDIDAGDIPQVPMNTARSDSQKRQRTSCGETNHSVYIKRRRIKNDEAKLDKRRRTEKHIWWANPGKEYDDAKFSINKAYTDALSYGIVDKFYEHAMFDADDHADFTKRKKLMRQLINRRIEKKATKLDISNVQVVYMDNPYHGQLGQSRETLRTRQTIEEILRFEYRMRTLEMQTCCVCRENRFEFEAKKKNGVPTERSTDGSHNGIGNHVCDICRKNKNEESDHFLKNNLQPVWYERDDDGSIRTDFLGEPVVRYGIPQVLKKLTMAEKLLIRRCSPLIPSHHIKNGIYGINGHCVAFPQNIGPMCSDLPQKESNMVIFVRHVSNRVSGVSHSQHFKVNKNKVLDALRWLKVHHRGYHDITITESNLDWIKKDSVYDVAKKHSLQSKPSRREAVADAPEAVSGNQCKTTQTSKEDEYEIETVHPNYKDNTPNASQSEIIKSFETIARQTNQEDKILDFPFIDHGQPLK